MGVCFGRPVLREMRDVNRKLLLKSCPAGQDLLAWVWLEGVFHGRNRERRGLDSLCAAAPRHSLPALGRRTPGIVYSIVSGLNSSGEFEEMMNRE